MQFLYDYNCTVSDYLPKQASKTGGTIIVIEGSGFKPYSDTVCRFGDNIVAAMVISPYRVEC